MRKVVFALLFFGFFQFTAQTIYACQCLDHFTPLIVHYSRAESVFVGKVKNIKKFGNEPEEAAWYPKYRTVEFEIQRIYKGLDSTTKRINLNTNFNSASCGIDEEESPRKAQKWIVFVNRNEEDKLLYFGGMCDPSSHVEKASDLSEYENKIFSIKDKQGIFGTVADEMKIEGIKDIEVILEGNGQNLIARTDENGLYYFPADSADTYKITINLSFGGSYGGHSFAIKQTDIKPNTGEYTRPLKTILTYDVQLKEGEFNYEEVDVYVISPKK